MLVSGPARICSARWISAAVFPTGSVDLAAAAPSAHPRISFAIPERIGALLAVLIGFASVFSAVIAWRASLASIDASRYQSLAVQQQARREQIERELEGTVEQDQRFVAEFQEHALAARELQTQADSIRATDSDGRRHARRPGQSRAGPGARAPAILPGRGAASRSPTTARSPYDKAFVLRNLAGRESELRELRTSNVSELANRADTKSIDLVGVAALIVAALFFLTVAQVSRTRVRVRQAFFVAGGLLVVVGTLLFVFVEIVV